MTSRARSLRVVLGSLAAASVALGLAACGGGTDIAPSDPRIEGRGTASATLAGRDFGTSSQIDAVTADAQSSPATVAGESVTIRPDGYGLLAHGLLSSPIVTLTDAPPTMSFCEGVNATCVGTPTCAVPPSPTPTIPCDFWVSDATSGLLQVSPSGRIATGATVLASYSYNERLLTVNVGLTFPSGQYITLPIYNLRTDATASSSSPILIPMVASSAPLSPFPEAFNALVQTNLTTSGTRELFLALDDPSNLLTITQLDLTNEGNPCIAGTVVVAVRSDVDPAIVTLSASFSTPGC